MLWGILVGKGENGMPVMKEVLSDGPAGKAELNLARSCFRLMALTP